MRLLPFCLLLPFLALGEGKLRIYTAFDLGRMESGYDLQKGYDPSGVFLNRTYVDVGYVDQLDPAYQLSVGVGGIFWKAFETTGGTPQDKVIKFGPGISRAFMTWTPHRAASVSFGYFPYKYNAAAKNLGEYLFRTEAYPTIVYNGGWSWLNDAHFRTVGLKITATTGSLKHDLGLFAEYFNAPIYDLTPAYVATWKPAKALTVGGGGSLHRFFSSSPQAKKELTRKHVYHENFYFPELPWKSKYAVDIPDYIGQSGYDVGWYAGGAPNLDSLRGAIWAGDSSTLQALYGIPSPAAIPLRRDTSAAANVEGRPAERATRLRDDIILQYRSEGRDSADYFGHPENAGNLPKEVAFDLAAVKLLGFFHLDLNALFGLDAAALGEFGLYGEIAQLGLKDYPIFYTEASQRRPVMLGASIPTFGFLRHLSLEVEHLPNPVAESIASTYDKLDLPPDPEFRYRAYRGDDWKWSVHAARDLNAFLSVYVQVANDHLRLKDGAARPQYVPVTNEPDHWYWIARIQWTI